MNAVKHQRGNIFSVNILPLLTLAFSSDLQPQRDASLGLYY